MQEDEAYLEIGVAVAAGSECGANAEQHNEREQYRERLANHFDSSKKLKYLFATRGGVSKPYLVARKNKKERHAAHISFIAAEFDTAANRNPPSQHPPRQSAARRTTRKTAGTENINANNPRGICVFL